MDNIEGIDSVHFSNTFLRGERPPDTGRASSGSTDSAWKVGGTETKLRVGSGVEVEAGG